MDFLRRFFMDDDRLIFIVGELHSEQFTGYAVYVYIASCMASCGFYV